MLIDPKNPSSVIKNKSDNNERNKNELKANLIVMAVILAVFISAIYYGFTHRFFNNIS